MSKKRKKRDFSKKDQFVQKKNNNTMYMMVFSFIIAVVIIGYVALSGSSGGSSSSGKSKNPNRKKVGAVTYDANTEMTDIKSKIENGKIVVSLDDIKKNKLAGFTYPKNQVDTGIGKQPLPLLAYITPSGDLVVAVSMCEPCKSLKFHYETDGTMTCNACGTKWDIETLEGISGACTIYPPDERKYTIKDGKVYIDESEVENWKPRV